VSKKTGAAIDTLAAQAVGYDHLKIWTTYWGGRVRIGCCDIKRIQVCGIEWNSFEKQNLKLPYLQPKSQSGFFFDRMTNLANQTILRPRPNINQAKCSECGACYKRCPVQCVAPLSSGEWMINLSRCVDCHCCLSTCENGAVNLQFGSIAKGMRMATGRPISIQTAAVKQPTI